MYKIYKLTQPEILKRIERAYDGYYKDYEGIALEEAEWRKYETLEEAEEAIKELLGKGDEYIILKIYS